MLTKPQATVLFGASTFLYLGYTLANRGSWLRRLISKFSRPWVQVGTVSELTIFPIKSCRAAVVPEAECTELCMQHGQMRDRNLLLVNADDGVYITARQYPKMVRLEPYVDGNILTVNAPDAEPLEIDLDEEMRNKTMRKSLWRKMEVEGYDCGDKAAEWFEKVLKTEKKCRLVQFMPGLNTERRLNLDTKWNTTNPMFTKRSDKNIYADLTPYMLMTQSTLDHLNDKLTASGEKVFDMRNFRPNITVVGSVAHDEDKWDEVKIGDRVQMTNVKPRDVCIVPTIDPDTGIKHPSMEPTRTLKTYRMAAAEKMKAFGDRPLFGIHLAVDSAGPISVGDPVYVRYY